jgi:hypothetical protein
MRYAPARFSRRHAARSTVVRSKTTRLHFFHAELLGMRAVRPVKGSNASAAASLARMFNGSRSSVFGASIWFHLRVEQRRCSATDMRRLDRNRAAIGGLQITQFPQGRQCAQEVNRILDGVIEIEPISSGLSSA